MRSVSGVRGLVGIDLSPEIIARYARAFGVLCRDAGRAVVVGRDSRASGEEYARAASDALRAVGMDVVSCGIVPTPTVQLAVEHHGAAGGIVITASHNPIEWNALKFVGPDGLFLDRERAAQLFALADGDAVPDVEPAGELRPDDAAIERHIAQVLAISFVDAAAIRDRGFTVAIDCVRGVGGAIVPELLRRLGCTVVGMDLETDGQFPREPEPVPANLGGLTALVRSAEADIGMAIDPDGDRLAVTDETGRPIGEDYTLAFAVRSVLDRTAGPVVVNLSTSLVVDDAAAATGSPVIRVPVGEANVARGLRAHGAVVGGEGNGGVMLPGFHLGRDAPLAVALVLDLVARAGTTVSGIVDGAPRYSIVKAKVPRSNDLDDVYRSLERELHDAQIDRQDGLRFAWEDCWLHVRPSGTEPVIRLIAEAPDEASAHALVERARITLDGRN
jgi:phosphomannomutase